MHGLVAFFLGTIALAIILLVIGLVALCALVVVLTTIMALIVLMMIARLAIVAIASVALMVFVTAMLMGAGFMAMGGRSMSRFPFLWLLLVLGNLLKNTSCLVGSLTLLKESNHPERIGRHHLV